MSGETDKMVALRSLHDAVGAECGLVALKDARRDPRRAIPPEWLSDGPLAVNDFFRSIMSAGSLGSFPYYPPVLSRL